MQFGRRTNRAAQTLLVAKWSKVRSTKLAEVRRGRERESVRRFAFAALHNFEKSSLPERQPVDKTDLTHKWRRWTQFGRRLHKETAFRRDVQIISPANRLADC